MLKIVFCTLPLSEVLRPKSSNLFFGMNLANKVSPSHGGIGLLKLVVPLRISREVPALVSTGDSKSFIHAKAFHSSLLLCVLRC